MKTNIVDIVETSSDIYGVIDLHAMVNLSCGCQQLLYVVMLVIGLQVKHSQPIVCPIHNVKHDFSDHDEMKDYCVQFFDSNAQDSESPYFFTSYATM